VGLREAAGAVAEQPGLGFAELLRQLRADALLTQEELAEAAGLSPRSVSDLERGIHRTARKDTAWLLAGALGLAEPVRALFVSAARGRGPAAEVLAAVRTVAPGPAAAAATRTLPRDTVSFTGRDRELVQLLSGIDGQAATGTVVLGIHAIDGMAGIGKTTFALHAAHRLAAGFPDGQFFLPLHAHTPGQRPVDPADALASLLLTAGLAPQQIPPGTETRAARWRDHVAGKKILLLLDDAAGHEQVQPLLPGTAGSLVLITSRRRLTALADAAQISLDTLPPEEAAILLARLAARPGMRAGDPAVGEITRLCGYLPLAISMLASQLRHHPAWTAAALAASLVAARDRLTVMRAENLSVAAAFDLSYQDLTPEQQRLFRHLGLQPGTDIDAYAAAALDGIGQADARHHLDELYDQHLITEPTAGRYLLHDLLREHARALAAADDPAESAAAAGRLLDYYAHTAAAAAEHIPGWTGVQDRSPPGRPPACAPQLTTRAEAAAWMESERLNLHAAASQAASLGMPGHTIAIASAMGEFLRAHGYLDQAAALHKTALAAARQAGDRHGQALAHRHLGIVAWLSSDYPAAAASLAEAAAIYRDLGDQSGQAYALDHLGVVQQMIGDYPAATTTREQALALARSAGDQFAEAAILSHLGELQLQTGDYPAAAASLQQALDLFRRHGPRQGEAETLANLGVLQRRTGDYPAAAASLQQSLAISREIGHLAYQARAHDALGVVYQLTANYPAAEASHQQALQLYQDLGQRLGQARALNNLGQLATRTSATDQARHYCTQALAIARDIGVPLQEARALEGIGYSHLHDGNPSQAAPYLEQALTIYQRIGAPAVQRVQEYLHRHGLTSAAQSQPAAPGR
jgi:tetratricopeptide (TPR) repeat protein/transcriptional regulator with XRE-family HTH domain